MADESGEPADDTTAKDQPSSDISALIGQAKAYAQTELDFQKERGKFVAKRGKNTLIAAVLALFLAHLMLFALIIGLLLVIAEAFGAVFATISVTLALALAVVLLGYKARREIKEIIAVFKGDGK